MIMPVTEGSITEEAATDRPTEPPRKRPVVVVSGMSGAGLSTALKCLEDLGYEAVDNLPMNMVDALVGQGDLGSRPVAITVDARTRHFSSDALTAHIRRLSSRPDLAVRLVFLECADEILQQASVVPTSGPSRPSPTQGVKPHTPEAESYTSRLLRAKQQAKREKGE